MMLLIQPFESAEEKIEILSSELPIEHELLDKKEELTEMFVDDRGQYDVKGYVDLCDRIGSSRNKIVLGVTAVDLFTDRLNFVFGSARKDSWGCVISTNRLGEGERFDERVVKEAMHEVGHVVGHPHCSKRNCVMHFSNSLRDTDIKAGWFCSDCEDEFYDLSRKRGLDLLSE